MKYKIQEKSQCRWCEGITKQGIGPIKRPNWNRWQCCNCGAIGYNDLPSEEELNELYLNAWVENDTSDRFATGSTDLGISRSLLKSVQFNHDGRCLDYGGGTGQLASVLVEFGCVDVYVFEPYGNNPGLSISWVKDLRVLDGEKFDWIFMTEVIEHITDPVAELAKVYNLLSDHGALVITTPNSLGWRARIERFRWRESQNPTHINLFSEVALKKCLSEAGFSNIKRCYQPVQYKASGLKRFLLSITQVLGVDGGLRIIAKR
ncbi:class I SAM-dependent methyltransferase [Rubritalea marina]|uniref:class I SAM-dependent methyltransferase n=1 Tax=Rubritalea marina TaxID=361055 RepID=UPI00036849E0|nr:class I SAM-dependent methyltransferase [Rubritalea marina]